MCVTGDISLGLAGGVVTTDAAVDSEVSLNISRLRLRLSKPPPPPEVLCGVRDGEEDETDEVSVTSPGLRGGRGDDGDEDRSILEAGSPSEDMDFVRRSFRKDPSLVLVGLS